MQSVDLFVMFCNHCSMIIFVFVDDFTLTVHAEFYLFYNITYKSRQTTQMLAYTMIHSKTLEPQIIVVITI